jgi:hypothetical protein
LVRETGRGVEDRKVRRTGIRIFVDQGVRGGEKDKKTGGRDRRTRTEEQVLE